MNQFQEKILKIQTHLLNFAISLTLDKQDADDLTQDTLLKLLDSESKYSEKDNFKGWAFTIMRNLFINNYRKINKHNGGVMNLDNIDVKLLSDNDDPESTVNLNEIHEFIHSFSNSLSEPFSLYLAGYSYQEISDKINIPVGTVKSRIFVTRQKLKEQMVRY